MQGFTLQICNPFFLRPPDFPGGKITPENSRNAARCANSLYMVPSDRRRLSTP